MAVFLTGTRRVCAPARSSGATGSSAGCSASTSRRRRRRFPSCPRMKRSSGDLTLPQLLARHRSQESCAACHRRFDSIGLVFEGYGPIGERRDRDLGGRPVDARRPSPTAARATGLDGLRRYLDRAAPGRLRREPLPQAARLRPRSHALLSDEPTSRQCAAARGRRPPL